MKQSTLITQHEVISCLAIGGRWITSNSQLQVKYEKAFFDIKGKRQMFPPLTPYTFVTIYLLPKECNNLSESPGIVQIRSEMTEDQMTSYCELQYKIQFEGTQMIDFS